jgi:hypothetical protein
MRSRERGIALQFLLEGSCLDTQERVQDHREMAVKTDWIADQKTRASRICTGTELVESSRLGGESGAFLPSICHRSSASRPLPEDCAKLAEADFPFRNQLLFFRYSDMIHSCKVAPVVAAVRCFVRAGNLGLKIRQTIQVSSMPAI